MGQIEIGLLLLTKTVITSVVTVAELHEPFFFGSLVNVVSYRDGKNRIWQVLEVPWTQVLKMPQKNFTVMNVDALEFCLKGIFKGFLHQVTLFFF